MRRLPAIALAALLSGCGSTTPIISLSLVTDDIVECNKGKLTAVPKRDLSEAEVEALWKRDRYIAVQKSQCLNRMIVGDQAQSKQ